MLGVARHRFRAPCGGQSRAQWRSALVILGSGAFGARALDGEVLSAALAELGLRRLLLVLREDAVPRALSGLPVAALRVSWERLPAALELAAQVRAPLVILEPPALLGVERACRQLFALAAGHPALKFCLATPDGGALGQPAALGAVLEDLGGRRVGYWHRPSRARTSGLGDTPWLDALGRHLAGMSLDDLAEGQPGALPGLGSLDFSEAADAVTPGLPVALDVDPLADPGLLRFALDQLRTKGFA